MGKSQAYKAMQRARLGSSFGAPGEGEEDGMTDGSFHSPEWHAAHLASFNKTHTLTWEEFKKKQKATERFEAAYPIIKELALVGTPGYKAVKQASQLILPLAVKAMQEREGVAVVLREREQAA
ncbi:corepressor interacting with RBPJ 1 [Hordeum vulgare]|nr:corepressor interacting with RBPJ 1 [Hordeum vulgare]